MALVPAYFRLPPSNGWTGLSVESRYEPAKVAVFIQQWSSVGDGRPFQHRFAHPWETDDHFGTVSVVRGRKLTNRFNQPLVPPRGRCFAGAWQWSSDPRRRGWA